MEEYENFSEEFRHYWTAPRNTEKLNDEQKEFDYKMQKTIIRNLTTLEECIKKNTKNLITNKDYDIRFYCDGLRGIPDYEPIDQGFGEINKPIVPDEYTNLKYLEKPLKNIGLMPGITDNTKVWPAKQNQFNIETHKCDFDYFRSATIYIRLSNTTKETKNEKPN
jgi:hypothetical protein